MATQEELDQILGVRRSETPAAVRKRNWRAAQSADAIERRRVERQRTRPVERERTARHQRFQRLTPGMQDKHRQRDCQRHRVLRRFRTAQKIQDADDEAVTKAELEAAAANNADSDSEAAAGKYEVEVSDKVELSNDFIRACLNDRSDLFGPRPTVSLTKRARLRSYVVYMFGSHASNCSLLYVCISLSHAVRTVLSGTATSLDTQSTSCTRRRRSRSMAGHLRSSRCSRLST